jgi:NADPH:quinone reductase-like Zn-dependent oxidoreductase
MYAAVVTSFGTPPTYQEFPAPAPRTPHEVLVDVIAAGLHPRVRSQADGSHYTSSGELPLVPGIDGVGRAPDGTLRYFVLPDTTMGAMAEQTLVDLRRSIVLPPDADPVPIAAAMNPAMSAWVALRRRISFTPGQSVLVLGATGNAGRLAVQVAEHLGAGQVTGAGRRRTGSTVALDDLGQAACDADVVLDYLWGAPAAEAMRAVVTGRTDRDRPLTWIQIGSVAGPTADIPSAALRAARLQIVGSGQGSVPTADILAELPALAAEITSGTFTLDARTVPLSDVETAWKDTSTPHRLVITR